MNDVRLERLKMGKLLAGFEPAGEKKKKKFSVAATWVPTGGAYTQPKTPSDPVRSAPGAARHNGSYCADLSRIAIVRAVSARSKRPS